MGYLNLHRAAPLDFKILGAASVSGGVCTIALMTVQNLIAFVQKRTSVNESHVQLREPNAAVRELDKGME